MAHLAYPLFPHRHNADGSFDSICTECLATVATRKTEDELYLAELSHVCDPLRHCHVNSGRTRLHAPEPRRRTGETKVGEE